MSRPPAPGRPYPPFQPIVSSKPRNGRQIVPDQLGFGKSAKPEIDYSAPLFIPGFLAFLRQLPLGLGATHGAEDVDLLFVTDKPFPKVLRPQETDIATGAGGAFGPDLVSPFGHISISLGSLRFATCPTRGLTPFFSKANHCQAGWQGNRSGQLPGEAMAFPAESC